MKTSMKGSTASTVELTWENVTKEATEKLNDRGLALLFFYLRGRLSGTVLTFNPQTLQDIRTQIDELVRSGYSEV